ncbi:MAG: Rpn family recombination-promoting nuclease/putative transposase [Deltaproteobacteria bacterium]|nr:Rpn family recombination-promoting nuclease/putative transposase [Deltaproteobacteria bacterium]
MRPVFADLKTDFVFKKVFGAEDHKDILMALLNALLALPPSRRIVGVELLREEERPPVPELKYSVVDVKCRDASGTTYVVEMQVLNVEGFEKRVVYGASKAYVGQLGDGDQYPELNDVIAVSICNFVLWPAVAGEPSVPLVSHWHMAEQHGGRKGLGQVQYVFVELPKLPLDRPPADESEEWAYVFRQAPRLSSPPQFVRTAGPRAALEVARTALFTAAEWEAYDRAKIAEQDARGALTFAERRGEERGVARGQEEGLAAGMRPLERLFERRLGRALTGEVQGTLRARLTSLGAERLGDVVLDLGPEALASWLAEREAR